MTWVGWTLLAIILVYLGNVIGCMILCETIPGLSCVKKWAWMVPIINVVLFFKFLLAPPEGDKGLFWSFIQLPQKNLFNLKVMAEYIEVVGAYHQYPRFQLKKRLGATFAGIFANYSMALIMERR